MSIIPRKSKLDRTSTFFACIIVVSIWAVVLYMISYGLPRFHSSCIGNYDAYRVCDESKFDNCVVLKESEWTLISSVALLPNARFASVHDQSHVRHYTHHSVECILTNHKE